MDWALGDLSSNNKRDFFNSFSYNTVNVCTSLPCSSTYNFFSTFTEYGLVDNVAVNMSTNVHECNISLPSPPVAAPMINPSPSPSTSTKAQTISRKSNSSSPPSLPSSSTCDPLSADWICGCVHDDPIIALCVLHQWSHKK